MARQQHLMRDPDCLPTIKSKAHHRLSKKTLTTQAHEWRPGSSSMRFARHDEICGRRHQLCNVIRLIGSLQPSASLRGTKVALDGDGFVAVCFSTPASWGATVFVADMYGAGRRPGTIEEAQAFSDPLKSDQAEVRTRIRAALEVARRQCPSPRVAAIGFCFGGMNVLELARSGADLALAVSIHGDLLTQFPAGRGDIKGEILVLHGAADPVSPKSERDALEAEMEAAGATWMMSIFGRAVHSFTNPDARLEGIASYDAYAADWTLAILRRALCERA